MTEPLFLAPLDEAAVGGEVVVTGDEGHHAVVVRRIRVGERVLVADGRGRAIAGPVVEAAKSRGLRVAVAEILEQPAPRPRITAVQALPKGDRGERAVEIMTEAGIAAVVPWRASRCVTTWDAGPRGDKQLGRWRSTAREAAKQSRRFTVPEVPGPESTAQICERIRAAGLALVLHETATRPLAAQAIDPGADVLMIIGPEGGIAPDELDAFVAAGGTPVLINDAVLRTSTAGIVALAQIQALAQVGAARDRDPA